MVAQQASLITEGILPDVLSMTTEIVSLQDALKKLSFEDIVELRASSHVQDSMKSLAKSRASHGSHEEQVAAVHQHFVGALSKVARAKGIRLLGESALVSGLVVTNEFLYSRLGPGTGFQMSVEEIPVLATVYLSVLLGLLFYGKPALDRWQHISTIRRRLDTSMQGTRH